MYLSEAKKKSIIEKWVENHKKPVICPGCNEVIRLQKSVEVREQTKRRRS